MILSIDDGVCVYYDSNKETLPYSRLRGVDLKNRFIYPADNKYCHLKLFSSYMFMVTTSKTLFYPEISGYMGTIEGGLQRDQV